MSNTSETKKAIMGAIPNPANFNILKQEGTDKDGNAYRSIHVKVGRRVVAKVADRMQAAYRLGGYLEASTEFAGRIANAVAWIEELTGTTGTSTVSTAKSDF